MDEYLSVGKIVNTHGVYGELKVIPLTSDISRFDALEFVLIKENASLIKYTVERVKYHKQFVLVKLRGITDMNRAEEFKEKYMMVDRDHARRLDEDEYFISDLIGCGVFEGKNFLGEIADVIETGSNDVYLVNREGGRELLIPALKSVVKIISIENKRVDVILPEGLIDDAL